MFQTISKIRTNTGISQRLLNFPGARSAWLFCWGLLLLLNGCSSGNSGGWLGARIESIPQKSIQQPVIPAEGVYLGAILLEGQTDISTFNTQTGVKHAVFGDFFQFPDCVQVGNADKARLDRFILGCKNNGAMAMITIELVNGLSSHTASDTERLAQVLFNAELPVFLRWNHEMNGSWYAWGQQPSSYVGNFRETATIMHKVATNVAMTWTPNQGWGYPWTGGNFSVAANSADFNLMDTDGNMIVDDRDDPYTPYYPGDDAVDWVGFSFYHWSNRLERGYNEIPPQGKWGEANGINNPIINFHEEFAVKHRKPMMISETSAFFDTSDTKNGGADEIAIKKEWISQVYNYASPGIPGLKNDFPMIKAIMWFNQEKHESETGSIVDWRLSFNQEIGKFYRDLTSSTFFIKASDVILIAE